MLKCTPGALRAAREIINSIEHDDDPERIAEITDRETGVVDLYNFAKRFLESNDDPDELIGQAEEAVAKAEGQVA